MTTKMIHLTALLIALLTSLTSARAGWRGGIGVLGDSYSDEYQFYPPHRSTARNWVEILAATRGVDFGRVEGGEPAGREVPAVAVAVVVPDGRVLAGHPRGELSSGARTV